MDKPSDKVLIEYYTSALGPELAMFAKMKVKPTLVQTYQEAERVEAESGSIKDYPDSFEEKTTIRRSSLLSKSKEYQPHNYYEMMKVLQKMSNRIIDLEKERDTQKTHASLMKGLGLLRKEKNEKVRSFTQRFSLYLNFFFCYGQTFRQSFK